MTASLGKAAYATLFMVALPLGLVLWAVRLDQLVSLPAYGSAFTGSVILAAGAAVMAAATTALWVHGHGLPMSPYPPEEFVSRGVYRYLTHPMYDGAVAVAVGLALACRSPAGLWIVSPVLAAAAAAWVLGFERDATQRRYGAAVKRPLLQLPPATSGRPTAWDRWSAYILVFLPWGVFYQAVELLGVPPDAVVAWQPWDLALPILPWTEIPYALAYPFALLVPVVAATRADVRWFMTRGWVAMTVIVPLYLLLPIIAPAKPVEGTGILETLMRWERAYDAPVTAFPAFHVVWAFLAARVYGHAWSRLAPLWWLLAGAISLSCVTVGMHAAVDVVGGVAAWLLVVNIERIWEWVRIGGERLANSWEEGQLAGVRFINHGLYAAVGAWIGLAAAATFGGPGHVWAILGLTAAAIAGAALWAQLIEGSPQLLRPYGYFGSVAGAVTVTLLARALGADVWRLSAAFAIGAALTQAMGRGRCLVQGCCHGSESPPWLGLTYTHPRSRVVRLSGLGGRPLHPTQLYAAGWMLVAAAVLIRLWAIGAGLQFIVGSYFILTGLGRFVEEHYRGEPQTPTWRGLRLYQWLSMLFVIVGASITATGWTPAPTFTIPPAGTFTGITAGSVLVYVAYGVDFPRLNRRLSRLV